MTLSSDLLGIQSYLPPHPNSAQRQHCSLLPCSFCVHTGSRQLISSALRMLPRLNQWENSRSRWPTGPAIWPPHTSKACLLPPSLRSVCRHQGRPALVHFPGCSLRLECSFPDASLPRFLTFLQSLLKCHLTPTFKGQPPSTQAFAFPLLALFSHVALITVQ